MNRLDVYTAVHKMQRARLCTLVVEAGTTDPHDQLARQRLAAAAGALVAELLAHADHEDRFIHRLLRAKAPSVADKLDGEHHQLDAMLAELTEVAARYADPVTPTEPNVLYRALAGFSAAYFAHVAIEESEALPALWETCDDDELAGILTSFAGSRSATENLTSLLAQLTTLNPPEIARMVAAGLGDDTIAEVGVALATLLSPTQLGSLSESRLRAAVAS